MKVGILTYHSCLNYGANLQLYATAETLLQMGHEVVVYNNISLEPGAVPCRDFVSSRFQLTEPCQSDAEFKAETLRLGIDTICVGSDAVMWFLRGCAAGHGAFPNPYWLEWAVDLPVRKAFIAASSMGVMFPKLGWSMRKKIRKDLLAFDYIAVRDHWTLSFMRWAGIKNVDLVFDPTSCLPGLFSPRPSALPDGLQPGKYIMLTFSQNEQLEPWMDEFTAQAHDAGLKTVFVPHPDRLMGCDASDLSLNEVMDPFDWLHLLTQSKAYVGERFHPIVLSAFFGVPFAACDYYSKSGFRALISGRSKTKDFCKRIGGSDRLVSSDRFFSEQEPSYVLQRVSESLSLDIARFKTLSTDSLKKAVGIV